MNKTNTEKFFDEMKQKKVAFIGIGVRTRTS